MSIHLNNTFKGKKVFLTGHTGFKGSWLLVWLKQLGAIVKGYSLAPLTSKDLYYSIDGDQLCDSVIADIRDCKTLEESLLAFQPDFVFHLAAQPLVRLSYEQPIETIDINAMGSANLLNAIRKLEKPCVVVMITTDKVYNNKEQHYFYNEEDKLGGYDPYSSSKAAAEIIIESYRKSFFNPLAYTGHHKSISVARAGNVIGGGDWAKDRIIPDIIRGLQNNEPVVVRNPNSVRPWQHVLEPLHGYLVLAATQTIDPVKYATAFNFGPFPEDNLTVRQLVEIALEVWGGGEIDVPKLLHAPHEAGLLQLDISKAINNLDWKPVWSASKAINSSIAWYKKFNDKGKKGIDLVEADIAEYSKLFS